LAPRYSIRDRDRVYGAAVTHRLRAMGIRDKPIVPGSPWQNGFAERLIGLIRRECVDHIVVLGEAHLLRVLIRYAAYYDEQRTHWSSGKDAYLVRAKLAQADLSHANLASASFPRRTTRETLAGRCEPPNIEPTAVPSQSHNRLDSRILAIFNQDHPAG
jgi:transposase InsO family protein